MKLIYLILISILSIQALSINHTDWDEILKKEVKFLKNGQSLFNYQNIKNNPTKFYNYLKSLSDLSKKDYDKMSKEDQMAFLINAYNAFTVKLIIENYPLKSIKDIGSFFFSPWKKEFFKLLGKKRHLDYIEHEVLRKDFKEPRVHFAVVCASMGCPNLQNFAWTGKKLEEQFQLATKNFLGQKDKNFYDKKKKTLFISKIFKWYGDDFNSLHKSAKNFILNFYKIEDKKDIAIKWQDYKWELNEWK